MKQQMKHIVRSLAIVTAMAATALPLTPAAAQNLDDGHASIFDAVRERMRSGFGFGLGLGGHREERPRIDYRERAPLVVPPNRELRPPLAGVAERNQAWPRDFDTERVRRSRDRNAGGQEVDHMGGMSARDIRTVGRLQNNPARSPVTEQCDGGVAPDGTICDRQRFWSIMKNTRKEGDNRDLVAGQEPERRRLTDPPAGYRRAATTQK
ncbi:MAG: hypothetical protein FJX29_08130, partial [Alphaproteobacteria bacterium]|nr:hypothetical protein [Alphaproteobacteria bacterium]